MIVMFQGGGPAQGLYKNFDNKVKEIRVGTEESVADGMAAVYYVGQMERMVGLHATAAVANYGGMKKTAASLVTMMVD